MPKSPKELGAAQRFSIRGGVDVPAFGGINKQEDPGAIADNQFQELINVSWKGTKFIDRPGLTKINSSAVDGEIGGLFDPTLSGGVGGDPELKETLGPGSPSSCTAVTGYGTSNTRLYLVGSNACGSDPYVLYHFAADQSPTLQQIHFDPGHNSNNDLSPIGLSSDGETLWMTTGLFDDSANTMTYEIRVLASRHFNTRPVTLVSKTVSMVNVSPQAFPGLAGHAVFQGDRYFGTSATSNAANDTFIKVFRWDGQTLTEEDSVTIPSAATLAFGYSCAPTTFQEQLIVPICYIRPYSSSGFAPEYPDVIRKRTSAGVWSTLSLPASVTNFGAHFGRCAVYKGVLYIFGFGNKTDVHATNEGGIVLSYDGSSLSVAQTTIIAGSEGFQEAFRYPVVFDGYLYYLHTPSGQGTNVYVGRYDGSSWNNTYKNLSEFPVSDPDHVTSMDVYQGKLVVSHYNSTGTPTARLIASPGTSVSGTWTALYSATSHRFGHALSHPTNFWKVQGFSSAVL